MNVKILVIEAANTNMNMLLEGHSFKVTYRYSWLKVKNQKLKMHALKKWLYIQEGKIKQFNVYC